MNETQNDPMDISDQEALIPDAFEVERVVEALLFASALPLSVKELSALCGGWDESVLEKALDALELRYKGRGVELVKRGDQTWVFRSAADIATVIRQEHHVERKLSRAAMETLAIIAYHQPVTRAEIENIRGVAVGKGTLDLLIEAGWVQPGRRREVPGRPLTWKTTAGFLDHFALESLADLPGVDELKAAGLLDARPAIETVPVTGELFDDGAEIDEGADEEDAD
jgi:segregation and condensation protein B